VKHLHLVLNARYNPINTIPIPPAINSEKAIKDRTGTAKDNANNGVISRIRAEGAQ
jgi:hypothetical protein